MLYINILPKITRKKACFQLITVGILYNFTLLDVPEILF